MEIVKRYSHKGGQELLNQYKPHLVNEVETAIRAISAPACLTKETKEKSKIARWGGLLLSPRKVNVAFADMLYPQGWATWDESTQKYREPMIVFSEGGKRTSRDRVRRMDGIKEKVGLEIQMGKYSFMGYDIFSKMIIFRNKGYIDCGIEIVPVQTMIECMSTGVSAFEHLMIDFVHRGEADIDIPVLVLGIAPSEDEWKTIFQIQELYRQNPDEARQQYPNIGTSDLKGSKPGPKL